MHNGLSREFYKFGHKKLTWFAPLLLLIFMVLISDYPSARFLAIMTYDSTDAIMVILIIVGSTMFSMEFQNNAILTLLYKSSRSLYVYFDKFITIFAYNIILHGLAIIFTFILGSTIRPVAWFSIYQYHQPLILNMFLTTGIDIITSMLIISIVFLASTIINSNAVVITISMGIVFFGEYVSSSLLRGNSPFANFAKWNPFNMLTLTHQYVNHAAYYSATLLTNTQLMIGALIYLMIFFEAGYLIFRQKKF